MPGNDTKEKGGKKRPGLFFKKRSKKEHEKKQEKEEMLGPAQSPDDQSISFVPQPRVHTDESLKCSAKSKQKKTVRWAPWVEVGVAHHPYEYNRAGDRPWARLTRGDKIDIKKELNQYKKEEMEVHPDSEKYTRFHK